MFKRTSILLAVVTAVATAMPMSAHALPAVMSSSNDQAYIVRFADGTDIDGEVRNARAQGLRVSQVFNHVFPGFVAALNPAQAAGYANNPNVLSVEADAIVSITATQTPATWGLDRIDQAALPLNGTYNYPDAAPAVNVYVIDTGLRADHTQFTGRTRSGYSAIADTNGTNDCNGHGTHVAGTIAGSTYGVDKTAVITPVRVLDCAGSGTTSGVVAGLDWAVADHAAGVPAVANMSLGGGASSTIDAAVNKLINDGVTVVVAAGNSTADACTSSPARVPAAITVAASDASDRQASFSNYGSCVDLYAPGVSITSASYASTTGSATMSGTSMASPHVAGAVALLLAANGYVAPSQVATSITTNATAGAITNATTGTPNRLLFNATTLAPAPVAATAPSAPTGVTAAPAKRGASVSWTAPSNGGSTITGYTIRIYDGTRYVGSVTTTSASGTVSGLKTGRTYSFGVIATNSVGSSPESARSNSITAG